MPTYKQDLNATAGNSPVKRVDSLTGIPQQQMQPKQGFNYYPPAQVNQMGVAKPVFNQQTQGMAAGAFGTPAMMQKSVGVAYMTESQEEAFGPGGHSESPGLYKQLK